MRRRRVTQFVVPVSKEQQKALNAAVRKKCTPWSAEYPFFGMYNNAELEQDMLTANRMLYEYSGSARDLRYWNHNRKLCALAREQFAALLKRIWKAKNNKDR